MKKLLNKITRKKRSTNHKESDNASLRITNETVAAHRERILAGGRRFKYPVQYPKHRVVLITLGLVLSLIAALAGVCAWQLYGAQNTDKFFHRVTEVVPIPVADIDGTSVRYSDYLLELRSALHYLSSKEAVNFSSDDGKRQLAYQKRLALNKAIENAYIARLARENAITVSSAEVDAFIKQEVSSNRLGVTQDVYRQVIRDYYDWSFDDYRLSVKKQLLRKKVVAAVDTVARQKVDGLLRAIQQGSNFSDIAKQQSDDPATKANGGDVPPVPKNTDDPNKLLATAEALQPGQVSSVIEGADGFYLVKLIEKNDDTVHFAKILIGYRAFDQKLDVLKKSGKIKELITVPETINSKNQAS